MLLVLASATRFSTLEELMAAKRKEVAYAKGAAKNEKAVLPRLVQDHIKPC
jgi:hypothetical protein